MKKFKIDAKNKILQNRLERDGGEAAEMEYDQGSVLKRELHKMGF